MTTPAEAVRTDTDMFPAFESKEEFMTKLREYNDTGQIENIRHDLLYRISNTDTSTWADPMADILYSYPPSQRWA